MEQDSIGLGTICPGNKSEQRKVLLVHTPNLSTVFVLVQGLLSHFQSLSDIRACGVVILRMAPSIPSASIKGFQNALSYDKHRPSYPPEAVTRFLEHLQVSGVKGARIVDLAAGTGKLTELLAGRDEDFDILAVEPHSEMTKELEKKQLKGVKVLEGEASRMAGVENQSVDAVIVAQVRPLTSTTPLRQTVHGFDG